MSTFDDRSSRSPSRTRDQSPSAELTIQAAMDDVGGGPKEEENNNNVNCNDMALGSAATLDVICSSAATGPMDETTIDASDLIIVNVNHPENNNPAVINNGQMIRIFGKDFNRGYPLSNACSWLLFFCLGLGSVVIGSIFIHPSDCPAEPNLAPVLIANGAFKLLFCVLEIYIWYSTNGNPVRFMPVGPRQRNRYHQVAFLVLIQLPALALFVYLVIMIQAVYPKVEYTRTQEGIMDENFCNLILFQYSLYSTAFLLACLCIGVLVLCCACCCLCFTLILPRNAK